MSPLASAREILAPVHPVGQGRLVLQLGHPGDQLQIADTMTTDERGQLDFTRRTGPSQMNPRQPDHQPPAS
jgi:hypothetical protein